MKQLSTEFSKGIQDSQILPEYPRPMLVRGSYYNLNGLWSYAITGRREDRTDASEAGRLDDASGLSDFHGQILVPFSPESALSGVGRKILPEHVLWYRRSLPALPEPADPTQRVLLHFGAVDQHAWVYINGICVGEHAGGYLPFTCDITEALHGSGVYGSGAPAAVTAGSAILAGTDAGSPQPARPNTTEPAEAFPPADALRGAILTVRVVDPTDTSFHSRGKQKLEPSGMYYTAQSGIWQTVWMEIVPENYIERIAFRPDYDGSRIRIRLYSEADEPVSYTVYEPSIDADASPSHPQVLLTGSAATNHAFSVSLPDFKPWSPEEPYLYHVTFETAHDRVQSYFAMRKCGIQKDAGGVPRLFLNGRPYFQTGLLDQGYYPESLYTPPTDEAMIADIRSARDLGFNMLRKHAKIEPDRFYYHCDRLGMLVWQDMVNGGSAYKSWYVTYLATAMNQLHIRPGDRFRRLLSRRDKAGRDEFTAEVRDTIRALGSHPSIVVWVPFNEGWGQFDTLKICSLIKKMDPDRLVDHASGWFDLGGGDIQSIHYYFFRYRFRPEGKRVMALTEYGGYSWSVPGHCTHDEEYGYQKYTDSASLTAAFRRLITGTILPSVREGLSAAIYTQLTDIESETNGLYTYDRKTCKMDAETVRECNRLMKEAISPDPQV